MAYTVAQFITAAEAGNPIQITNVNADREMVIINIGGKNVPLGIMSNKVLHGDQNIKHHTIADNNNSVLDLGTQFTASEVLASRSLKLAIENGSVEAVAGTVALSSIPTV